MPSLNEVKISAADLIKGVMIALPCVFTILSAIWYFSTWSEKVDMRLDDIDRDLRIIHQHYEQAPTSGMPKTSLETYRIHHDRSQP